MNFLEALKAGILINRAQHERGSALPLVVIKRSSWGPYTAIMPSNDNIIMCFTHTNWVYWKPYGGELLANDWEVIDYKTFTGGNTNATNENTDISK